MGTSMSVCLSECRDFPLGQATCIIAVIVAQQLEPIVAYPTVTVIVFLLQFLLSLLLNYCLPIVVIPAAIVVPIAIVILWSYFRQVGHLSASTISGYIIQESGGRSRSQMSFPTYGFRPLPGQPRQCPNA
jgi:hypothetical protein